MGWEFAVEAGGVGILPSVDGHLGKESVSSGNRLSIRELWVSRRMSNVSSSSGSAGMAKLIVNVEDTGAGVAAGD